MDLWDRVLFVLRALGWFEGGLFSAVHSCIRCVVPPAAELRVQLVAGGSRWQGTLVTDKRSAVMGSLAPGAQATRSMQLSSARLASAVKISLGSVVPVVTTSIKPSKVLRSRWCAKVLVGARGFILATESTPD